MRLINLYHFCLTAFGLTLIKIFIDLMRCVFKKIRTDFINGLGGRKGKDRTTFRPTRQKEEAEMTISSFSRAITRKENRN